MARSSFQPNFKRTQNKSFVVIISKKNLKYPCISTPSNEQCNHYSTDKNLVFNEKLKKGKIVKKIILLANTLYQLYKTFKKGFIKRLKCNLEVGL